MPGQPTPTQPLTGELPPAPVPVIPEMEPIGPPSTIPSAPQRVLPPTAGLPIGARFQFEPSVTLSELYSDNFNLTKTNKVDNFRSTISPGLRIGLNLPQTKGLLGLTFAPSYDSSDQEFSYFYSLLGQVIWQPTPRWQLTVADTYTRSDQPGEADRLGLRQQRQTFDSNTFALTSDYLIGPVATRGSYRLITFSDDASDTTTHALGVNATVPVYQTNTLTGGYEYITSDTEGKGGTTGQTSLQGQSSTVHGHQFTGAAARQFTTLRTVGVKGSYGLRTIDDNTGSQDFQIWTASVFGKYVLPGRLTIDGSLGVTGLSSDRGDSIGPKLFSASAINYSFGRAIATLAYDSGFSETFSEGQNFGVVETQGVTGSLYYPFTPAIAGTLSGYWRRNKPTEIQGLNGGGNSDNTTWGGTLAFSWRILRGLLLDLSYTYTEQTVNNDRGAVSGTSVTGTENGYTENRVQASLRFTF